MLEIQHLSLRYGDEPVLNDISLTIKEGEIVCLLGRSGSGKTTLLRAIAGLEDQYTGDILLHNASMRRIPVHQRNFGLMFQDFALFPHMTVAENIEFGLQMRGNQPDRWRQRVDELLALVGLSGFGHRDVSALSGGERQRVALARSLAPQPRLLMLDEPLGSLDAELRDHLLLQLREIIKTIGLTAIYVTHDQREAFAVADRIAILQSGRIEQIDTPQTLYFRPRSVRVAQFLGLRNVVPVTYDDQGQGQTIAGVLSNGSTCSNVLIHHAGLHLAERSQATFSGVVTASVFEGQFYRLQISVEGHELIVYEPAQDHIPQIGDQVHLIANPELIVPLEDEHN